MNKSALDNAMWGHGDRSLKSATLPYENKIEEAKRWLGDRYLLAQPINKPRTRKLEHA